MRCIAISDTHGMHNDIQVPDGDVLIHAGDFLGRGKLYELESFNKWLGNLPHKHKIIVAGNHDWCFERDEFLAREILTNGLYLQDESVLIDGVEFYGSPWQPEFFNWAFNLPRGRHLREKWNNIPETTQVLITHGPPHGILDLTSHGIHAGCEELRLAVERIKPSYHIFGHIHEGYGSISEFGCHFINASTNTVRYRPANPPIVFDI